MTCHSINGAAWRSLMMLSVIGAINNGAGSAQWLKQSVMLD
ncbi:MAG: hypothetical protein ACRC01_11890 [Deefgea sp.]